MATLEVVDAFAGPGGWDEGARALGIEPLGIELDKAARATRKAAGHRTLRGDVAELDPDVFAPCEGVIASPPCPAFSNAGKRDGTRDLPLIYDCARALRAGRDERAAYLERCQDKTALLVVEPLRWWQELRPAWIALEQVPPVLDLWRAFAEWLREDGYSAWAGILSAEQYGVPQTRRRAFLLASREREVYPPPATHQAYEPGVPAGEQHTLEGVLLPWVSMAEALGWAGGDRVGFPRRNDLDDGAEYRERDRRAATEPAFNLTEKARSWTRLEERQAHGTVRQLEEPAPTLTASMDNGNFRWHGVDTGRDWKKGGTREDAQVIAASEPSPALDSQVGGKWRVEGEGESRPVSIEEAAVLQAFPRGYPWQGNKTEQFRQVGNAVPPPLARAVLSALTGRQP